MHLLLLDSKNRTEVLTFAATLCQFHQHFTYEFLYKRNFGSFLYVHVTREKLPKQRSYEKFLQKLLMKLTTGVNFINILCRHLLYERLFSAYNLALNELSCLKFAQKMLMKLNTGLNYKLICR